MNQAEQLPGFVYRSACVALCLRLSHVASLWCLTHCLPLSPQLIKFTGCYHGHADQFLVQAGSGVLTLGLSDSPGVPATTAAATLTAKYNDLESVKALFEANKGEIAGLILEPVVGNSGFIPPTKEFLQGLRDLCTQVCLDMQRRQWLYFVCKRRCRRAAGGLCCFLAIKGPKPLPPLHI